MKLLVCGLLLVSVATFCEASTARLLLATTTSVDNSGLLEVLIPPFEKMFNVRVDVIAVGTGKALELARNGDVDVVLVHARDAEEQFVKEGYGVNHRELMHNDFIIVGPPDDPAGIKGIKNAALALRRISEKKAQFVSRGDNSGTHQREKTIWKEVRITPAGNWYTEVGQGMGATLQIADEKRAYTISDRGTYLVYKNKVELVILVEGDPARLSNPYSIIAVNPAKHPHSNYIYAMALIGWVTSAEGQRIIGEYRGGANQPLFYPSAVPLKSNG